MIEVLPSILAADPLHIGDEVARLVPLGITSLHVDIMDGHFVPNLSFGPHMVQALKAQFPTLHLDVHLMLSRPGDYIDAFARAGAGAITVHVEADGDMTALLTAIRARGLRAGLSLKPATPVEAVLPYLSLCDLMLVMTVEPGFGGQHFMEGMLPKLRALRAAGFAGQVMVDGGVNPQTALQCVQAGADALVMGTALLRAPQMEAVLSACQNPEGSLWQ